MSNDSVSVSEERAPDLTFSAEDLEQLAAEAVEEGDFDGARDLADNAADTREAQSE